jgi:hypothetical protein
MSEIKFLVDAACEMVELAWGATGWLPITSVGKSIKTSRKARTTTRWGKRGGGGTYWSYSI